MDKERAYYYDRSMQNDTPDGTAETASGVLAQTTLQDAEHVDANNNLLTGVFVAAAAVSPHIKPPTVDVNTAALDAMNSRDHSAVVQGAALPVDVEARNIGISATPIIEQTDIQITPTPENSPSASIPGTYLYDVYKGSEDINAYYGAQNDRISYSALQEHPESSGIALSKLNLEIEAAQSLGFNVDLTNAGLDIVKTNDGSEWLVPTIRTDEGLVVSWKEGDGTPHAFLYGNKDTQGNTLGIDMVIVTSKDQSSDVRALPVKTVVNPDGTKTPYSIFDVELDETGKIIFGQEVLVEPAIVTAQHLSLRAEDGSVVDTLSQDAQLSVIGNDPQLHPNLEKSNALFEKVLYKTESGTYQVLFASNSLFTKLNKGAESAPAGAFDIPQYKNGSNGDISLLNRDGTEIPVQKTLAIVINGKEIVHPGFGVFEGDKDKSLGHVEATLGGIYWGNDTITRTVPNPEVNGGTIDIQYVRVYELVPQADGTVLPVRINMARLSDGPVQTSISSNGQSVSIKPWDQIVGEFQVGKQFFAQIMNGGSPSEVRDLATQRGMDCKTDFACQRAIANAAVFQNRQTILDEIKNGNVDNSLISPDGWLDIGPGGSFITG